MDLKGDMMFSYRSSNTTFSYKVSDTIPLTGNEHTIYLVPNKDASKSKYDEYIFYLGERVLIGTYNPGEETQIKEEPCITNCPNCSAIVRPGQKCEYCGTWVHIRRKSYDSLYL